MHWESRVGKSGESNSKACRRSRAYDGGAQRAAEHISRCIHMCVSGFLEIMRDNSVSSPPFSLCPEDRFTYYHKSMIQ